MRLRDDEKAEALDSLDADIAVVPECSRRDAEAYAAARTQTWKRSDCQRLLLGVPSRMAREPVEGDGCPNRLDHTERPSSGKKPVEAREDASTGEGENETGMAAFQRVHDHHEAEGGYAKGSEQRPQFARATWRARRPAPVLGVERHRSG